MADPSINMGSAIYLYIFLGGMGYEKGNEVLQGV
jgi:hypothetical protein